MAGFPSVVRVEVEWTPGVWTDESAHVDYAVGITCSGGRATPFDDASPSTLSWVFRNGGPTGGPSEGRFTPDSPLSPLWPNVVEDKAVRLSLAGPGGSPAESQWWTGRIDTLDLDIGAVPAASTVTVTAVGARARTNRTGLYASVTERARLEASYYGRSVDAWPMLAGGDGREIPNVGAVVSGSGRLQPARILLARGGADVGSWSMGDADGPVVLDGAVKLDPVGDTTFTGPVVWCELQRKQTRSFGWWFRAESSDYGTSSWPSGARACLASFWTTGRQLIGSIELGSYVGGTALSWVDADGFPTGQVMASGVVTDGQWHYLSISAPEPILDSSCSSQWSSDTNGNGGRFGSWYGLSAMRYLRHVVLGGLARPGSRGFTTVRHAYPWSIGPAFSFPDAVLDADANEAFVLPRRALDVGNYLLDVTAAAGIIPYGSTISAPEADTVVTRAIPGGGTIGDALDSWARTIGGSVDVDRFGRVALRSAAATRTAATGGTSTPDAVVTMGADDVGDLKMRRGADGAPTRVTASWPGGSAVFIDPDRDQYGSRDESVDTMAYGQGGALAAAAWRATVASGLQLRGLSIDLVTAETDLWAAARDIRIGARWRVDGLPSEIVGVEYAEVHIEGWSWVLDERGMVLKIETSAAGPEWRVGDANFRVGLPADAALSAAMTPGATSLTFTSSVPLTTSAGAYPLALDVGGEIIAAPNPPASAVSPQTLTGVSRGGGPSVARAHAVGERVDLWAAARVTI